MQEAHGWRDEGPPARGLQDGLSHDRGVLDVGLQLRMALCPQMRLALARLIWREALPITGGRLLPYRPYSCPVQCAKSCSSALDGSGAAAKVTSRSRAAQQIR